MEYQETPISLGKAAKKYSIPQTTLTEWAKAGRLRILARPERRGQPLLVDEGSVIVAMAKAQKKYVVPIYQATMTPQVTPLRATFPNGGARPSNGRCPTCGRPYRRKRVPNP